MATKEIITKHKKAWLSNKINILIGIMIVIGQKYNSETCTAIVTS